MGFAYIIHTAARATLRSPHLWGLGVFLATGFNVQLLFFDFTQLKEFNLSVLSTYQPFWGSFFGMHPALGAIIIFLLVLVLGSWAKVLVVLSFQAVFKLRRAGDVLDSTAEPRHLGDRRRGEGGLKPGEKLSAAEHLHSLAKGQLPMVREVILLALFTTAVMLFAVAALSVPFVSFAKTQGSEPFMVGTAVLLLLFFVFAVSCISIFASFFIILLKLDHKKAINVTVDLLMAKWQEILASVLLLVVIYLLSFMAGALVITLLERVLQPFMASFGGVAALVRNVVLWGWLSVLNVFFYAAMVLFFVNLVKPKMTEETSAAKAVVGTAQVP